MSETVQMRVRVPAEVEAKYVSMSPSLRKRAIAAVLIGASDGVDLHKLMASTEELRRIEVSLKQALKIARTGGGIDVATKVCIKEALRLIERLRGQS